MNFNTPFRFRASIATVICGLAFVVVARGGPVPEEPPAPPPASSATLGTGDTPPPPPDAPAPSREAQTWQGQIDLGVARLDVVLHLEPIPPEKGAGFTGTLDIPAQGAMGLPLKNVLYDAATLSFQPVLPGDAEASFVFKPDPAKADELEGTLQQSGQTFPVHLRRLAPGEAPSGPNRPQNPLPPFPYKVIETDFPGGAEGVTLSATITIPEGDGPHPGAVLVSGSGPQDRDETLLGHKPFLVLADHLSRRGIAVLRYDDRGTGRSTGDFGASTTDDFALDAGAALKFLASRPGVDPARVGVIGHSEGGLIGPMVAAADEGCAFVVMLAGPGVDGRETLKAQLAAILRASGVPEEQVTKQSGVQHELLDALVQQAEPEVAKRSLRLLMALQMGATDPTDEDLTKVPSGAVDRQYEQLSSPWMRRFLELDPREALLKVKVPVLALNGTLDTQVLPELNLKRIEATLTEGGNTDHTCLGVKGLNHLFQNADTGSPAEYAQIEETMSPAVLEKISGWIRQRTGLDPKPEP